MRLGFEDQVACVLGSSQRLYMFGSLLLERSGLHIHRKKSKESKMHPNTVTQAFRFPMSYRARALASFTLYTPSMHHAPRFVDGLISGPRNRVIVSDCLHKVSSIASLIDDPQPTIAVPLP